MDKNFKVRVSVGVGMFAVALVSLYTFNAIPFKIIFGAFAFVSALELFSFFRKKITISKLLLAELELLFLILGTIFVAKIDPAHFWYIILGVPGYDIFAYLFGKMLGGKIIKKSRPFPHVSKNKTWEGTIFGLLTSVGMVAILMAANNRFGTDFPYLFCGPLALIGDLLESFLKRRFAVKDSNEILIKNKFFEKLELVVGGSEGHGGFLDRIDSTAFACSVLLIIFSILR